MSGDEFSVLTLLTITPLKCLLFTCYAKKKRGRGGGSWELGLLSLNMSSAIYLCSFIVSSRCLAVSAAFSLIA